MPQAYFLKSKKILVTGGASFIGSHLVDSLAVAGVKSLSVVDDLSSGKIENISEHIKQRNIEFVRADLRDSRAVARAVKNIDAVFHLAADHGGRGYIDRHQAACATNLTLDGNVFYQSKLAGVEKIVFASSGCVYPTHLQSDPNKEVYLAEDMVSPPYNADNLYGWAKLMGELTLKAYAKEWSVKAVSCRFFTVYGERGHENHAVIAIIARAFIRQNPFEVWGDGEQIRNWTYVGDIVKGLVLAAEKINDGTAINLGTMERIRVIDAVRQVLEYTGVKSAIKFRKDMPTGPLNRVADNSLAKKLLGWEPEVKFSDGLKRTIDWYFAVKNPKNVKRNFDERLNSR